MKEYGKQLIKSSNKKKSSTLLKQRKNFDKCINEKRDEI